MGIYKVALTCGVEIYYGIIHRSSANSFLMTRKKPQFLKEKRLKWKRKNKKVLSRIYRVDDSVMTLFPNFFHQHILLSSHIIIKRFSTFSNKSIESSTRVGYTSSYETLFKKKNLVTCQIWLNWQH